MFHITNEEKACRSQWMLDARGLGIPEMIEKSNPQYFQVKFRRIRVRFRVHTRYTFQ